MTSPLSPEAVAQMVARLRGITLTSFPADLGDVTGNAADMLTTLAAENATLRASEAAALERVKVLAEALQCGFDYVEDASKGYLQYRGKQPIIEMATEDLKMIEKALTPANAYIAPTTAEEAIAALVADGDADPEGTAELNHPHLFTPTADKEPQT